MMEQMGLPVEGMISRQYLFTAVSAFTAIVVKCEPEQADYIIEQHIMGGGSLDEIYAAYVTALRDSDFFKKLLHMDEQEKSTKKSQSRKTEQKLSESEK